MEIARDVHLIPGIIANAYLVTDPSGLTLIDAALPNNAAKILRFFQEIGCEPGDLRRIIITHADIDHVGSLESIRQATHAAVATSQVEAEAIRAGKPSRELKVSRLAKMLMSVVAAFFKAKPSQVDEILAGGEEFPLLGGAKVIATPGHTPGHLSLWSPSRRILFSGDSILVRPDSLLPSQGANNWDADKSVASFKLQSELHPALICGGHGWTDQDIEQKFARYLSAGQIPG
jgi:glyoxylase-like metal-dependent hydrolase (beta-lactamase superfamily II)